MRIDPAQIARLITENPDVPAEAGKMKASQLVEALQEIIAKHGDLVVVSGVARSGYGETVLSVEIVTAKTITDEDQTVIDLVLDDESTVAVGGF